MRSALQDRDSSEDSVRLRKKRIRPPSARADGGLFDVPPGKVVEAALHGAGVGVVLAAARGRSGGLAARVAAPRSITCTCRGAVQVAPARAVVLEFTLEIALGRAVIEPRPERSVPLVVTRAEHALALQACVHVVEDLCGVERLEGVDRGLAGHDRVRPAGVVPLAAHGDSGPPVELRVLEPLLSEADVRAVGQEHELPICTFHHNYVVVVVVVVVAHPQHPVDALVNVNVGPVEVLACCLLEVRSVKRVRDRRRSFV